MSAQVRSGEACEIMNIGKGVEKSFLNCDLLVDYCIQIIVDGSVDVIGCLTRK